MSSSIHVEGASVQELKDLAYTPNTYSIADSVQNVLSAKTEALNGKAIITGAEALELTAPAPAPISFADMTFLAREVTSFPDNVPMAVKDNAQTLLAASDSNDESIRLALYDTDTLTFSSGSFVSISELREFMGLKQFDLSHSTFELRDSSSNILGLLKSNASDKSDILGKAASLKLTDTSATTFSVDDATLLLSNNVAMPNGYKVSDIASEIQGEVKSASDIGALLSAKAVTVTDSNALTLSVAEYNKITESSTPLNATHKIADVAAAIEAAVGTGSVISNASSIAVGSGVVDLSLAEFRSLGSKFTDKADISITEAAKSFNTSTSDNLNGVNSIEIVAAADYTDLRNAIQNSGADTVNLAGVSNVKVSVDQAKAVTFKGSGGFQINDDATAIIGLANDSSKSSQ